jgi:hypothetical protein
MHDGTHLERRGIPTAVVCTDPFINTAKFMARTQGMPDYPFVVLPHPIATLDGGGLEEQVERALPQVLELLLASDR